MMGSASALRRQAFTPAAATQSLGVPAAMGGTVGASVNVSSGDGSGALLVLTGGVIALVLFYLWTHSIQGGP